MNFTPPVMHDEHVGDVQKEHIDIVRNGEHAIDHAGPKQ